MVMMGRIVLQAATVVFAFNTLADCTLTNTGVKPVNDLGFGVYKGVTGGLYPGGGNGRPDAHESAGVGIAREEIRPRDSNGNVETNSGRIVLLSIGMSNTTQEWASKGTNNFKRIADADPSKNPRLAIVDGAQGGQAATDWTNFFSSTWTNAENRLRAAGVTTNQVQVIWMKQARRQPLGSGQFPLHAQRLQEDEERILRVAKQRYPNLRMAYLSSRTRAYTAVASSLNPEPFAFESCFSVRWLIERQLAGNLNYDPTKGVAVAPWLSWGPYLWADGTVGRSDGFQWLCSDLESDFTHPSALGGVPKVARQLLAFFKTDPTATPWFLRSTIAGQPPVCAPTASVSNGLMPMPVTFSANASDPDGTVAQYVWTFEDGGFSFDANPTKVFPAPGQYRARVTVTDNSGNTATGVVIINVTTTYELWRAAKFGELSDLGVSGPAADPDSDGVVNELEYLLNLEPQAANSAVNGLPRASIVDDHFTLTFTRYRAASDRSLQVEWSPDLVTWNSGAPHLEEIVVSADSVAETVEIRDTRRVSESQQGFLRLTIVR
jgi:PKD repeat protein